MTTDQLTSQSLLCWIERELPRHRALARQELPGIDLDHFFEGLAKLTLPGKVSVALVGFGANSDRLRKLRKQFRADQVAHLSEDLHEAGAWRNERAAHPYTVALARGRHPGVNTLQHQEQASSARLVGYLLEWAREQDIWVGTPAHRKLLQVLASADWLTALSFEQVRAFLSEWVAQAKKHGPDAPRQALPALGLFLDPDLFEPNPGVELRLAENLTAIQKLRDLGAGPLTVLRKRVAKSGKPKQRDILSRLEAVRRDPSRANLAALTLAEVQELFVPKPDKKKDDDTAKPEDEDHPPLNQRTLPRACADALLDNREEELRANAETLAEKLDEAVQGEETEDEITGEITVAGDVREFSTTLDRSFVGWIHKFCSEKAWGGLVESADSEMSRALADYDRPGTLVTDAENLTVDSDGAPLGLTTLFAAWDDELAKLTGKSPGLAALWREFVDLRRRLLPSLNMLAHFPLDWFAGKRDEAKLAKDYLAVAGKLYGAVAAHYDRMVSDVDQHWARNALEGVLALDIVQARVQLERGQEAFKAVLLPTHPLHLWRYWRLSEILRGLGSTLAEEDRKAVLEEVGEPQQFLSVIFASRFPGGHGAARVLPVANDIHRLATFENLRNACQADDGQETLVYAVERFAAIHRQHAQPLRLVLINPPAAGQILLGLLKLLDGRRRDFIPCLQVDVRGTPEHAVRLRSTLPFDTRERDLLEESIASGRLDLRVNREPRPLAEHLAALKAVPCHLLAVFDESTISIRRGGAGLHLPMSPFCVRRNTRFDKFQNALRLEPADTDPPFGEFLKLLNKAEGAESEGNSYAWGDAQHLRDAVDATVCGDEFSARWFFLADRALPSEGRMEAKRLLRRRAGQRQVFLAVGDYGALVRLIRPVFEVEATNLLVPIPKLEALLAEGAHLVGAGVLELVKSPDGTIIKQKVIGLMGLLLAARDYRLRHPGSLVVSTDSQLARLWLRLGEQGLGETGKRSDLLALREEKGKIIFEIVEVKSSLGERLSAADAEIVKAKQQVAATVEAIRDGLSGVAKSGTEASILTAPRCEMLKEVLVAGAMNRDATKDDRTRWADWMSRIFRPHPEEVGLRGLVVGVWMRCNLVASEESLTGPGEPYPIRLRHLGEPEVERLLGGAASKGGDETASNDGGTPVPPPDSPPPASPAAGRVLDLPVQTRTPAEAAARKEDSSRAASGGVSSTVVLGKSADGEAVRWSPIISGNPHLMMVGLPGMGKTTCLVNICRQLAAMRITPIVFSYHDDIDAKLGSYFSHMALTDTRHLGFNPLRISGNDPRGHIEAAGLLRDIFSAIFPDLGDLQLETLRGAIKASYESKGWGAGSKSKLPPIPGFRDFLGVLQAIPKKDAGTKALLARLNELDDYEFFQAAAEKPSLLDETRPVVLQIHQTQNEHVQRAYASFAFYRLYQEMFRRGRQERLTHAILFDEAHRACRLKLIPTMAKECRKFGLALVLASQEARDFDPSLFSAVANYLILRVTEDTARHLVKNVVASNRQRAVADKLKQLPKYEALWLTEGQKSPVALRLSA